MSWYVDVVMVVGHRAVLDIPGNIDYLCLVQEVRREEGEGKVGLDDSCTIQCLQVCGRIPDSVSKLVQLT